MNIYVAQLCRILLELILAIAAGAHTVGEIVHRLLHPSGSSSDHISGSKRGSRPSTPKTIALVFAEPDTQHISIHNVANIALWCTDLGLEYIYLYDPAGLLLSCKSILQDYVCAAAACQGLGVTWEDGWRCLKGGRKEVERKQKQQEQQQNLTTLQLAGLACRCQPEEQRNDWHLGNRQNGCIGLYGCHRNAVVLHLLKAQDAYSPVIALAQKPPAHKTSKQKKSPPNQVTLPESGVVAQRACELRCCR